jgi:hypothetical protein
LVYNPRYKTDHYEQGHRIRKDCSGYRVPWTEAASPRRWIFGILHNQTRIQLDRIRMVVKSLKLFSNIWIRTDILGCLLGDKFEELPEFVQAGKLPGAGLAGVI